MRHPSTSTWARLATWLAPAVLAGIGLALVPAPAAAQGEVVEYYATDAVGSTRVVFAPDGSVKAQSDYLPFGEALAATGNLPPQRFTGQERDGEAGLDNFNARGLSSRVGRFSRVDPLAGDLLNPQRWNPYPYVLNNPLSLIDPTGLADYRVETNCNPADPTAGSGVKYCPPQPQPFGGRDPFENQPFPDPPSRVDPGCRGDCGSTPNGGSSGSGSTGTGTTDPGVAVEVPNTSTVCTTIVDKDGNCTGIPTATVEISVTERVGILWQGCIGGAQGLAAAVDGAIPIIDPLENWTGAYDSGQYGLDTSQELGAWSAAAISWASAIRSVAFRAGGASRGFWHALNHNRYVRIGTGTMDGRRGIPRVSFGKGPPGPWNHMSLTCWGR